MVVYPKLTRAHHIFVLVLTKIEQLVRIDINHSSGSLEWFHAKHSLE
jgi:hypothetical protein